LTKDNICEPCPVKADNDISFGKCPDLLCDAHTTWLKRIRSAQEGQQNKKCGSDWARKGIEWRLADVRDRAVVSVKADADRFAKNVAPVIREIQSTGVASHRGIARSLNSRGVATARGGAWTAVQVGSILRRAETH
jgi:hypothetical protein